MCECPKCHDKFSTLSAFDRHQDVDYKRPHADVVRCLDPASRGLIRNRHGAWGWPSDARSRARIENFRAEDALTHSQT